jgi:hypothetical protein
MRKARFFPERGGGGRLSSAMESEAGTILQASQQCQRGLPVNFW